MITDRTLRPPPPSLRAGPVLVRPITAGEHAAFARAHAASFLQTPAWASVKPGWQPESLGWFAGGRLAGTALVLHRRVPGTHRSLAYVPEGPCLPWQTAIPSPAGSSSGSSSALSCAGLSSAGLARWLDPFVAHLRAAGAFAVRIGPPVPVRRWNARAAKAGLADPAVRRFSDLAPAWASDAVPDALRAAGFVPASGDAAGFGLGQPEFGVRLDLRTTPEALLTNANQQWRRNVARSAREGVVVREGSVDDLPAFAVLYRETADRDGFTPRPAAYFLRLLTALGPAVRLYLAERDGEALAAAIVIQKGDVGWYAYGASTARHRSAQASTAVQWHAITEAHTRGCRSYDLRGVTGTLDPADPAAGLLRFKLGTGGDVVQTAGEWELPLSRVWYRAFRVYLDRRAR